MNKQDITVIIGPTAIGKSDFAIDLAIKENSEIISADAFQVYRGMDIGTGKISKEQLTIVPHHLIDVRNPDENWTVADFINDVDKLIEYIRKKNKNIIICGGTGFYIQAFLYQYTFSDITPNEELRMNILNSVSDPLLLWDKLNKIDPKSAVIIDKENTKRVLRALEVFHTSGSLPSDFRQKSEEPRSDTKVICLYTDRETIHHRINKRVELMFESGLLREVKELLKKNYSPDLKAFEAIGYKECIKHIHGDLTYAEVIELVKLRTRQFSKRQMTWFKRFKHANWININK